MHACRKHYWSHNNNVHSLFPDNDNPGHHNNPHSGESKYGNPHNKKVNASVYNGAVSLYDLRHGSSKAPGVREFSVRCLINVENWTAWRLKVNMVHIVLMIF